jgi:acylaminoacyl-peptidase
MSWSPDGTKLVYLAEKKVPKSKPFSHSSSTRDNPSSVGEPDVRRVSQSKPKLFYSTNWNRTEQLYTFLLFSQGEEYAFKQSWGEQLRDVFESVIVVLDVNREDFQVVPLPDQLFPSDLQWLDNSSLIGTGYVHTDWRLGLIYCSNRESRIFQVGTDGSNFSKYSKTFFMLIRCIMGELYCYWPMSS